jgi:hypothetical protein
MTERKKFPVKEVVADGKAMGVEQSEWQKAIDEVYYEPPKNFLEFGGTVTIPKMERFVVRDHFKVCGSNVSYVNITDISYAFQLMLLNKVEESVEEMILLYSNLREEVSDNMIINRLGGEDQIETTLAQIYHLMKMHGRGASGENGALLMSMYEHGNIFYVRDINRKLCPIRLYWSDDGWRIIVDTFFNNVRGGTDMVRRVFSRGPVMTTPTIVIP